MSQSPGQRKGCDHQPQFYYQFQYLNKKEGNRMNLSSKTEESFASHQTYKKIDHYLFKYTDLLGTGNFSKVYLGVDEQNNKTVAIKVIHLSKLTSNIAKKLLHQEISILKLISHPNTLHCFNVLSSANNCYIITEICQNGDLQKALKIKGKFDQKDISSIIYDVYKGLLYLNSQEIIHRDIKIANIFIAQNGQAKIADFGFAIKAAGVFSDINIGSPIYMSPEGLIKHQYSCKTDIWSFGVMIYELLHGYTPLSHCRTEEELKTTILQPVKYLYSISSPLKDLMDRCLQINPQKRIHIKDMMHTEYFQKLMIQNEGANRLKNPLFSVSINSTETSFENRSLCFMELNYETAVALLHYGRLIHKTCQMIKSSILSQWLLNVFAALTKAQVIRALNQDQQKYHKLRQVIYEYYSKYQKQHQDYRSDLRFQDVLRELDRSCQIQAIKNNSALLLRDTLLLRKCYRNQRMQKFGEQSQSKVFLLGKN